MMTQAAHSAKPVLILLKDTIRPDKTLKGHSDIVNSVSFSPDGKILASASRDGTIILWDLASGNRIKTISGYSYSINFVFFDPEGKRLVSRSDDETISIWDVATGNRLRRLKERSHSDNSVSISPDVKILASTSNDATITLWDHAAGNIIKTFQGHSDDVNSLSFSPDGKILASGSKDTTIILWDVAAGNIIKTLKGHSDGVRSVSFSPDGKTLASGSVDTTINLWDIRYNVIASADKTVAVNNAGCALDSDGDGVFDCSDICLDTPAGTKVDEAGCPVQIKEKISIDLKVEFASDKADIKKVYFDRLEKVAYFLNSFPDTEAVIEGHTDSVGSEKYNLKLSQRRSDSVKTYLTDKYGIAPSRLKAKGFGESMPLADNNTTEGRQKNRRVIAVISTIVTKSP